jgi:hypothetical protein
VTVTAYVSATSPLIVNNIELRIASVKLLRPAIFTGDYNSLHTIDQQRLQVSLLIRNLSSRAITYRPWRKTESYEEQVKLSEPNGDPLIFDLALGKSGAPASLPVGALAGPAVLVSQGDVTADVLLFEPPGNINEDLKLDLPGVNLGAPNVTLHIRIPALMIQS